LLTISLAGCGDDSSTGEAGSAPIIIDSLLVYEDARIQSDNPGGHYGQLTELSVVTVIYAGGVPVKYCSLVKLPPLPDEVELARLNWAELILHYLGRDSARQFDVFVHEVDGSWSEVLVSWSNAPAFDSVPFDSAKVTNHELRISVAPIYLRGNPDYGVLLQTADGTEQVFQSSEPFDTPEAPIIEIGYRTR
jgi:hypothetical protein